ncbi:MAG: ATP synthase F1 subunit epsilon [Planctomycetota bacterium]|jgi:F-type H+-transporting ATPase subunit epsilon
MTEVKHPPGTLASPNIANELAHPPGVLQVVVVSPARPIYEGEARWLTVRASDGQLGIWPRHTDLVAALGAGLLRIGQPDGSQHRFAIWGGFLKVTGPKVTVLVDRAVDAAGVDAAAVQKDLAQTLAALRHPRSDEEFSELIDRRRWCESRLRLVR